MRPLGRVSSYAWWKVAYFCFVIFGKHVCSPENNIFATTALQHIELSFPPNSAILIVWFGASVALHCLE